MITKIITKIITHNGTFHADDVFAVATLNKIFSPLSEIIRIPNHLANEHTSDGILVDIGGGTYDHHGRGNEKFREDGSPYASFGLVWRDYGKRYVETVASDWFHSGYKYAVSKEKVSEIVESVIKEIDNRLAKEIDALDNGVKSVASSYTMSNAISAFNPDWTTDIADQSEYYDQFISAMKFANRVLENEVLRLVSSLACSDHVQTAYINRKNGIIVLPRFMPWKEQILQLDTNQEVLFVIYLSKNGYDVVAVPPSADRMFEQRVPFPQEWRGLNGDALADVSGVSDAVFCHNAGFQCAAKSLEGALEMVTKVIDLR